MKKRLFLLSALAILTAGCSISRVQADPRIFVDGSVPRSVEVLTVDYGESDGANPVVSLAVRNNGGSVRRLRYRAVWFEPSGSPVDSIVSTWKTVTLDPGGIADLRAVSPHADTQGFRFEIRKAP